MANRELHEGSFRIIWDGLGCFRLLDVPVLFPAIPGNGGRDGRALLPDNGDRQTIENQFEDLLQIADRRLWPRLEPDQPIPSELR
jgi:hypothetical protein